MAKTIFTNGHIYTLDERCPVAEAVVVEGGEIVDVGSHQEMILQWGRAGTKQVDLQGKMVTPGLIDSHLHLSGVASYLLHLDLKGTRSKQEMLDKIRERAASVAPGEWLIGMGWDENLFRDGTIPTMEELDAAAPHCPIFLKRVCHHAFLVNSKALEIAGYHPAITVPAGGRVDLHPETNQPTGLLLENASQLITDHIPAETYDQWKRSLKEAMKLAVKHGLTSVHSNDPLYLGGLEQTWRLYTELIQQQGSGLRCHLLIDYPFLNELKERGMYAGYGDEQLQIGAIKILADGAFGRRTALLSQPYADAPDQWGEAIHEQETLRLMISEVRKQHMPVAVHTIGDQALQNVLDILDELPAVAYRDRLIHVSLVRDDLVPRLVSPTRIADVQPRFVVGDYPWIKERLGEQREKNVYAWNKLLAAGVRCAGGSDAPIEPLAPLLGIHAAVTRRGPEETHDGWNQAEKLTMLEALRLFTIGGAYATNEEHRKGTISPGKLADMTVFSRDWLKAENPDELLATEVEMTIIGGVVQEG